MSSSDPIAVLQSAATDLGKLLSHWSGERVAEITAPPEANPQAPAPKPPIPDLGTIHDAVQTLWRLVSIQKAIVQLKAGVIQPLTATHVAQPPTAPKWRN